MRLHPLRAVSSLLLAAFASTSVSPAYALRPAGLEEQSKKSQDEVVTALLTETASSANDTSSGARPAVPRMAAFLGLPVPADLPDKPLRDDIQPGEFDALDLRFKRTGLEEGKYATGLEERYSLSPLEVLLLSREKEQPEIHAEEGAVFLLRLSQKPAGRTDHNTVDYLLKVMPNEQLALMDGSQQEAGFRVEKPNAVVVTSPWGRARQRGTGVVVQTQYGPVYISSGGDRLIVRYPVRQEVQVERIRGVKSAFTASLYTLGFNRLRPAVTENSGLEEAWRRELKVKAGHLNISERRLPNAVLIRQGTSDLELGELLRRPGSLVFLDEGYPELKVADVGQNFISTNRVEKGKLAGSLVLLRPSLTSGRVVYLPYAAVTQSDELGAAVSRQRSGLEEGAAYLMMADHVPSRLVYDKNILVVETSAPKPQKAVYLDRRAYPEGPQERWLSWGNIVRAAKAVSDQGYVTVRVSGNTAVLGRPQEDDWKRVRILPVDIAVSEVLYSRVEKLTYRADGTTRTLSREAGEIREANLLRAAREVTKGDTIYVRIDKAASTAEFLFPPIVTVTGVQAAVTVIPEYSDPRAVIYYHPTTGEEQRALLIPGKEKQTPETVVPGVFQSIGADPNVGEVVVKILDNGDVEIRRTDAELALERGKQELRKAFGHLLTVLTTAGTRVYSGKAAEQRLSGLPKTQLIAVIGAKYRNTERDSVELTPASAALTSLNKRPQDYRLIETTMGQFAVARRMELVSAQKSDLWESIAARTLPEPKSPPPAAGLEEGPLLVRAEDVADLLVSDESVQTIDASVPGRPLELKRQNGQFSADHWITNDNVSQAAGELAANGYVGVTRLGQLAVLTRPSFNRMPVSSPPEAAPAAGLEEVMAAIRRYEDAYIAVRLEAAYPSAAYLASASRGEETPLMKEFHAAGEAIFPLVKPGITKPTVSTLLHHLDEALDSFLKNLPRDEQIQKMKDHNWTEEQEELRRSILHKLHAGLAGLLGVSAERMITGWIALYDRSFPPSGGLNLWEVYSRMRLETLLSASREEVLEEVSRLAQDARRLAELQGRYPHADVALTDLVWMIVLANSYHIPTLEKARLALSRYEPSNAEARRHNASILDSIGDQLKVQLAEQAWRQQHGVPEPETFAGLEEQMDLPPVRVLRRQVGPFVITTAPLNSRANLVRTAANIAQAVTYVEWPGTRYNSMYSHLDGKDWPRIVEQHALVVLATENAVKDGTALSDTGQFLVDLQHAFTAGLEEGQPLASGTFEELRPWLTKQIPAWGYRDEFRVLWLTGIPNPRSVSLQMQTPEIVQAVEAALQGMGPETIYELVPEGLGITMRPAVHFAKGDLLVSSDGVEYEVGSVSRDGKQLTAYFAGGDAAGSGITLTADQIVREGWKHHLPAEAAGLEEAAPPVIVPAAVQSAAFRLERLNAVPRFLQIRDVEKAAARGVLVNASEDLEVARLAQALGLAMASKKVWNLKFYAVVPQEHVEELVAELAAVNPDAAEVYLRPRIIAYDGVTLNAEGAREIAVARLAEDSGYASVADLEADDALLEVKEITRALVIQLYSFFREGGLRFAGKEAFDRLWAFLEAA